MTAVWPVSYTHLDVYKRQADKSVYHYYSDFAEKGYYNRIIAGNINQVLKVKSLQRPIVHGL